MYPVYLMKGVLVGFVSAMPIGPIGILCVRRALTRGRQQGITTGLAGAAADIVYMVVAIFSIKLISDFVALEQYWIRLCGGLAVLAIGIFTVRSKPAVRLATIDKFEHTRLFLSTFVLALSNPVTLFGFVAVLTAIGFHNIAANIDATVLFVPGVFLGSLLWFLMLSNVAHVVRKKISEQRLSIFNKAAGVILIVLGVVAIVISLRGFS